MLSVLVSKRPHPHVSPMAMGELIERNRKRAWLVLWIQCRLWARQVVEDASKSCKKREGAYNE